jgi:hypothetical protein
MTWIIASLLTLVPTAGPPATPPAVLVTQLGSEDFTQRQSAENALRGWGLAALPALEAALDAPDLEQYRRLRRLLRQLRDEQVGLNLKRMQVGWMPERLGLWNHFRRTVGDTHAAREMFRKMYALQGAAFEELDLGIRRREWHEVRTRVNTLCDRLWPEANIFMQMEWGLKGWPELTPLLTATFLSGLPGARLSDPQRKNLLVNGLLSHPDLAPKAQGKDQVARVFHALAYATVEKQKRPQQLESLLLLTLWEARGPALEFARSQLRDPAVASAEKGVAASLLGWYGERADLELILPLLEDKTIYPSNSMQIQVRDLALVALVKVTGADVKGTVPVEEYPHVVIRTKIRRQGKWIPVNLAHVRNPIFYTDAERDAAFAAWRKWAAAH